MLISLITLATLQIPFERPPEPPRAPYKTESKESLSSASDLNLIEEIPSHYNQARLSDALRPPSIDEVSRGALLQESHSGEAVLEVKNLLKSAGYQVSSTNRFDASLRRAIGEFQETYQLAEPRSPYWGKVGPSTLSALRSKAQSNYDPGLGEKLAQYARQRMSGYQGSCYRYVALAIHANTESFLKGYHAYMAADYLASSRYFSEINVSDVNALEDLPAGAIVVWGKGNSRSGHISIADGRGNEISDHMRPQMLSHYGGASARVFLPVAPQS
jgi:hypothetical protein